MKTLLAAILCIVTIGQAQADEVIFHTMSYHTQPTHRETTNYVDVTGKTIWSTHKDVPYNNYNAGLGYRADSGWMVGYYDNSYNVPTFYAAQELMFTKNFGMFLGVATGYSYVTGNKINGIGGFEYKYALTERQTLNLLFLPPVVKNMAGVAHIALSYKL